MIEILDQLPEGILAVEANQLHEYVANHTLVKIQGKVERPLFISILQHGDETTGWDAIKALLLNHQCKPPRTIYLYFGNVVAAAQNLRQLDGQPDFNRCWPGLHNKQDEVSLNMAQVTEMMKKIKPFASIDIHNNSGRNPHYAGINSMQAEYINLASLFADTIIYFTSPDGIQSGAFAPFCPAVTIECGMSGTADGIEQTHTFLENLVRLHSLETVPGVAEGQHVLNVFSTVKVKPDVSLGIENSNNGDVDFLLKDDLDYLNFHATESGTVFGHVSHPEMPMPLVVTDQTGHDITDHFFEKHGQEIRTKQAVMPAMITESIRVIKLDCLCYFMHPINTNLNQPITEQRVST